MKKLDKETFIEKSKEIHGDKYNYDLVKYKNVRTLVKIICPNCGIFEQLPWCHMNGNGCSKCQNLTNDEFIKKSKEIHGEKYNYDLVNIKNNKIKVSIKCKIHGIFEQSPRSHLRGSGCCKCFIENRKSNVEEFILHSNESHKNEYDYTFVDYINNHTKVKIICKKHGIFEQRPNHHLNKIGCPICKSSKGEKEILYFLEKNEIKYERQKKINGCKNKNLLLFDFYLPDFNMCIEYNGAQHYNEIKIFGGEDNLIYTKNNDSIKREFCKNNNIHLLIIKYNEDIESTLKNILLTKF